VARKGDNKMELSPVNELAFCDKFKDDSFSSAFRNQITDHIFTLHDCKGVPVLEISCFQIKPVHAHSVLPPDLSVIWHKDCHQFLNNVVTCLGD
jgi:hypothetical protein